MTVSVEIRKMSGFLETVALTNEADHYDNMPMQ